MYWRCNCRAIWRFPFQRSSLFHLQCHPTRASGLLSLVFRHRSVCKNRIIKAITSRGLRRYLKESTASPRRHYRTLSWRRRDPVRFNIPFVINRYCCSDFFHINALESLLNFCAYFIASACPVQGACSNRLCVDHRHQLP